MTSETDNKVEAAVSLPGSTDWWTVRRVANGDERCPWYELSREDIAALAAEVEHWKRLEKTADDLAWHNASKLAKVEAKLSALVEAAKPFARWIESARGAPWRAGPVLTANGGAVITVADFDAIRQALASLDRTAPESAEPAQEVAGLVEETKAEKIARLQCEIAERQAQLRFLVLGDATARVVGVVTQQLAAFTTKGMDQ